MGRPLEEQLVRHGGAVFLGYKPAALFTVQMQKKEMALAAAQLAENGLALEQLCRQAGGCLVLVYHAGRLEKALACPLAGGALAALGYPAAANIPAALAHLKTRFVCGQGFPHEIGFFLGYPPEDVLGFMAHKGRKYKYCCTWKVYGSVEKAMRMHEEYEACRLAAQRHIEQGGNLQSLFYARCEAGS